MNKQKPIIGITMGDPNGVGTEVILKTFQHDFVYNYCTPVLYGSAKIFNQINKMIGFDNIKYNTTDNIDNIKEGSLNLIDIPTGNFTLTLGAPSKKGGEIALKSIDRMLQDATNNKLHAVVTAPVDKNTINANTPFSGHTGYIANALKVKNHLMILFSDVYRVALVTEHIPVSAISKTLTKDLIVSKAKTFINSLRNDFGIVKPKIAVLGLNPHAGDSGTIGVEEESIIIPAIEELSDNESAFVFGPYSADGLWGSNNLTKFDGVLAMYHDQGLTPFKALAFNEGVNFTAGLPIIRTSPDHGTGYSIADKFEALPSSFSASLFSAIKLYATRKELEDLKANFLPFSELKRERFRIETRDFGNI